MKRRTFLQLLLALPLIAKAEVKPKKLELSLEKQKPRKKITITSVPSGEHAFFQKFQELHDQKIRDAMMMDENFYQSTHIWDFR